MTKQRVIRSAGAARRRPSLTLPISQCIAYLRQDSTRKLVIPVIIEERRLMLLRLRLSVDHQYYGLRGLRTVVCTGTDSDTVELDLPAAAGSYISAARAR